jgi:IS30 family transposase
VPQVCTVCAHPKRTEMERAHLDGQSVRAIARRCGTSRDAITRHMARHLAERMSKAAVRRELSAAEDLVERLFNLNRQALEILKGARVTQFSVEGGSAPELRVDPLGHQYPAFRGDCCHLTP